MMKQLKNDVFCLMKSVLTVAVLVTGASGYAEDNKVRSIVCSDLLEQNSSDRKFKSLKPNRMQTKIVFTLQQIIKSAITKNGAMFIPAIDQLGRALPEQVAFYMSRLYGSRVDISEWTEPEKQRFLDFPTNQALKNHLFEQLEIQTAGLLTRDAKRFAATDGRGLRVDFFNKAGDKKSLVYAQYEQMNVTAWYPAIVRARTNRFQTPILPFELGRKPIEKKIDGFFFLSYLCFENLEHNVSQVLPT